MMAAMNHSNDVESNSDQPEHDEYHNENSDQRKQEEPAERPIEIPPSALSSDALDAVIDSFILREGTDYGNQELSHEAKVARIRKQLEKSEIKLVFDASSESVTFMTKRDWQKLQSTSSQNIKN